MIELDVAARWREVRAGVDAATRASGRDPSSVIVVAVSKLQPASAIAAAAAAGVTDVGENYAQELATKQAELTILLCAADAALRAPAEPGLAAALRWHFIGKLQRNKVRQVVGRAALIHAVDNLALAEEIAVRARAAGVVQEVLVAANTGGEAHKTGVGVQALPALLDAIDALDGIAVRGLMTMPPWPERAEDSRPFFRLLRQLRDAIATDARPLSVLSMGTSADAIVAIEEGATLVRIGTAIFGERPAP